MSSTLDSSARAHPEGLDEAIIRDEAQGA